MFNCCSHGTLLQLQSSRFSLEYLLLPTKICTVAAPGGLTPGTFTHATATLLLTAAPRSDVDLQRQNRYGPSTRVSSGLVLPGIVSHIFRVPTCARQTPPTFHKWNAAGLRCAPPARERGSLNAPTPPACTFISPPALFKTPLTRAHVRLLGPCFQDGSGW
ncbi:hypothetical protein JTE90_012943 [Oedothorax gibbosus]|uniref:Uncharacterized protein n=1 Tax=Oedothorax gibbosus TaxID=931172 RepID=A0AAV6TJR9_9ARAC|nr:hypothetical protein JTE90_012943 [Oedothorax gibbosus]